jgi:8-amino-7-oxononanoate synthase
VPLQLATLGKALAAYGAAVLGDDDHHRPPRRNRAPYIYTTALPPAQARARWLRCGWRAPRHWRRDKLRDLTRTLP